MAEGRLEATDGKRGSNGKQDRIFRLVLIQERGWRHGAGLQRYSRRNSLPGSLTNMVDVRANMAAVTNVFFNYREFDLEGDLVGVPYTRYLSSQSFIILLNFI